MCVQLTKDSVPGVYYCPRCSPRSLDVQKAKAIQRQRREEEQAKRSHKKKRPASTSHKKKELTNGSNGITSTRVLSAEKVGAQGLAKSASPGGMQQTSTRKRAHRAPTQTNNSLGSNTSVHHTILLNNVPGANASPGSPNALFSSRNGETESDTDPEKPAKYLRDGFTDLGNSPNKYASADVQGLVQSLVMIPSNPDSTTSFETQFYYSRPDLLGLPKASAQILSESSNPRSEHSRRRLLLDVDCSDGDLIAIYKGEIGHQDSYKKDGANQYSAYYHPKPYVLFHPNLPVYVDARRYGTEARFVRRSCRPNLALKTIVIDRSEICFGLFANQSLKLGTELTVSWDWSGAPESLHFVEGLDVNRLSADHLKELAIWMHQLTLKMGDCACSGGKDCLLNQIRKMAGVDPGLGKAPGLNGNSRKQRKTTFPVEAVANTTPKQPSPEQQAFSLKKEEDDESRSVSPPASRSKPRSRDLTPSTLPDTAVEMGEMTGREARKFKEVLSRIEKQQQEEQQPPSSKRRKRNSTVSLTALHSPGIEPKDGMKGAETSKRHKLPANQRSPYSPPATTPGSSHVSGEYTVADASVGRRASGSPISSDEKRNYQASPLSPIGQGLEAPKRNGKTIAKPPRLQYQDRAIQTDNDEEVPWWSPSAKSTPPRAPRLPLRKRLMQSLLRDREEAAAIASEDKKRKHDAVSDEADSTLSSKVPKLSSGGSVRVGNSILAEAKRSPDPPPIAITSPTPLVGSPPVQVSTVQEPTASALDPSTIKSPPPLPSGSPLPGPSLANLFPPDPEKSPTLPQSSGPVVTTGQALEQLRNSARQDRPHVNGFRNANLQISPPPSSGAPNGPAPLSGSLSSAASSITLQSPLSIVPSFANPSVSALNNFMIQPSPTRTKKLSLQDYGKRKHKAEAAEKSEDKTATKPAIEAPASSTNATKPTTAAQEAHSTTEPSPGVLPSVPSQSLDVNSTKMVTGMARPLSTPGDQRAASSWNVR